MTISIMVIGVLEVEKRISSLSEVIMIISKFQVQLINDALPKNATVKFLNKLCFVIEFHHTRFKD